MWLRGYMVAQEPPSSEQKDDILVVLIRRVFYAHSVQTAKTKYVPLCVELCCSKSSRIISFLIFFTLKTELLPFF